MNIELHSYDDASRDYIFESYVFAMKQHIEKIWGWDQTWQETNFSQSLDKYITFTLHIDNERAGYIQFEHTSEFTFLSMIVLDPSHQSKGYGVEVLKKIQELDPERPIKLRCFRVNESAYNFYIKNGFKEIESDQEFQTLVRGKDA